MTSVVDTPETLSTATKCFWFYSLFPCRLGLLTFCLFFSPSSIYVFLFFSIRVYILVLLFFILQFFLIFSPGQISTIKCRFFFTFGHAACHAGTRSSRPLDIIQTLLPVTPTFPTSAGTTPDYKIRENKIWNFEIPPNLTYESCEFNSRLIFFRRKILQTFIVQFTSFICHHSLLWLC